MKRPWLSTTWHGGNNAQPEPRFRVLAVTPLAATFWHMARVRMGENGPEGEYLEDSEIRPRGGGWVPVPVTPTWRRFRPGSPIPAALLEQAELEHSNRSRGSLQVSTGAAV